MHNALLDCDTSGSQLLIVRAAIDGLYWASVGTSDARAGAHARLAGSESRGSKQEQ